MLAPDDFTRPVTQAMCTHFLTATAAARRMTAQGSGVILMLSSSAARESSPQKGGFSRRVRRSRLSHGVSPARSGVIRPA